jgi:3'-phosphoadenosine 5'-phosphosulfate (PAPS) 3'-phosphatase
MISRVLHQHWPNLTIVGEESLHGSVKSTNVDLKDIDRDLTTEPYLQDQTEDLAIKNSCVWIDPVDGTLSYTEGNLDEVSTLIGLSYKNRARLGVIGLPYLSSPLYKYSPRVFFGSSTHRRVY